MVAKVLTLWDIDGNMVNVYKLHTPAYQNAFKTVFRIEPSFEEIEGNYGRPAREVVCIPLRTRNIDEVLIEENIERIYSIYSKQLEDEIKKNKQNVILPGVIDILETLERMGVPKGIVTGNIKKAGESIIKTTGLYKYFNPLINSYGDYAKHRSEIVANALERARKHNIVGEESKTFVFGDTPSDILAAQQNNCVSIAVVKNSNEESSSPGGEIFNQRKALLEKCNPDYLFNDYTNTKEIISIINRAK